MGDGKLMRLVGFDNKITSFGMTDIVCRVLICVFRMIKNICLNEYSFVFGLLI